MNLLVDARAIIGEGPAWLDTTDEILWVDISRGEVHRFHPGSGREAEVIRVGEPVGAAVPRASGGLALATASGFKALSFQRGTIETLCPVEEEDRSTRMNDGKCDARGRFWAGTMAHDASPGRGALYVLDEARNIHRELTDVTISNGIGWNPENTKMYYIDSADRIMYLFDYDLQAGSISNRRTFIEFSEDGGLPDGLAVDSVGCIWVAMWDGWAVHRYSPYGELVDVVGFPVPLVTSCAFGGSELRCLYVTSARRGMSEKDMREEPGSGGVFVVETEVAGLPTFAYAD